MTPLEQEIVELTKKWYAYVNLDHHKDRDCHWTIEQRFSYGDEPYYQAEHSSYIGDDFSGTKCDTLEEAQEELREELKRQLYNAKQWLIREIKWWEENKDKQDNEDAIFFGDPVEYRKMLDLLNGENK